MPEEVLLSIRQCVIDGDAEGARLGVQTALGAGIPALRVIEEGLVPGIEEVGNRFGTGEYFLPDLMLGAKAMEEGVALAHAGVGAGGPQRAKLGIVVLGTVEGDIHEIGKNLVALLMRVNGFAVIDLGVNVPAGRFVQAAREHRADIVGLSALLTATMARQKDVVRALHACGLAKPAKIMVGGAPINQQWADEIGADAYSPDAVQAVQDARRLLQSKAAM